MENFLPGFNNVKAVDTGARGSLKQAAAPWQALGGVGNTLTNVGDRGVKIAVQQKEMEVKRKAAEMELAFADMRANFEQEMLKDPNSTAEQSNAKWEEVSTQFMSRYGHEQGSPLENSAIGMRAMQLTSSAGHGIASAGIVKDIAATKNSMLNLAKRGEATGDYEMVDNSMAGLRGIIPDEQIEAISFQTYRNMAKASVLEDLNEDPLGSGGMLTDRDSFLADNPYLGPQDYYDAVGAHEASKAKYYNKRMDDFNEHIASGELNDPDRVSEFFPEIAKHSPATILKMENSLRTAQEAKNKAIKEGVANDPAAQRSIAMALLGEVDAYKPEAVGAEIQRADILARLGVNVPKTSPYYTMIKDRISQIEDFDSEERKGMAQVKLDSYLVEFDREHKSKEKTSQTPSSAHRTGFLSNKNLKYAGFSEEQAKKISDLYKPYDGDGENVYTDPSKAAAARKKQLEFFRVLYPKRKNRGEENQSKGNAAMMEALYQGKSASVEVENDAMQDNYFELRGEIISKYNKWAKENPEKARSEEKVNEYFSGLQKGNLRRSGQKAND